ncbi:hypothetical protein E6O75_ATG08371 [Venturia nashicola]|uniref:Uncharacterized protein n=1 Tax=Venturia nashicola TaxID=86259 RepID=A0A4Z1P390_9PEZI|nr:hypothetical protein E6O75_ATG08371 [Venturia nashicola]
MAAIPRTAATPCPSTPPGIPVSFAAALMMDGTTIDECIAETLSAGREVSGSSGSWRASDCLLTTVEVGEARKVWCAITAESTALNAVGSLNTAEVRSLTSTSDTTDVAERSTNDGTAGRWDSTTVVVGVAEWYTWVTLATNTLVETAVDDGSGCVVSVVYLLAVVSKTLRVADLSLTGWLELNWLCWVSSTVVLAWYISGSLRSVRRLVSPQIQMLDIRDIGKCRQIEGWYTRWLCLLAEDSSEALTKGIGHTIEPVPILHLLKSLVANGAAWTAPKTTRPSGKSSRLRTATLSLVVDSVADVLGGIVRADLLLSTMSCQIWLEDTRLCASARNGTVDARDVVLCSSAGNTFCHLTRLNEQYWWWRRCRRWP